MEDDTVVDVEQDNTVEDAVVKPDDTVKEAVVEQDEAVVEQDEAVVEQDDTDEKVVGGGVSDIKELYIEM